MENRMDADMYLGLSFNNVWEENNELHVIIAGLCFHVEPSEENCGAFGGYLMLEPDNPHDCNAIAIFKGDGKRVGYIPRSVNLHILTRLRLLGSSLRECV